jgi:hypothetical protein
MDSTELTEQFRNTNMEPKDFISGKASMTGRPVRATAEERLRAHASEVTLVEEYETIGLRQPDPFAKFSVLVQGDLFRDAYRLVGKAMRALAADSTATSHSDPELAIECYLGVTRRILMNAQLEVRAG